MQQQINIPKIFLFILNQLFEIEQKVAKLSEPNSIQRNIDKLKELFKDSLLSENVGLELHNPIGEEYNETRTDCEASISGESTENLKIVEVIKPIIRLRKDSLNTIVQKG